MTLDERIAQIMEKAEELSTKDPEFPCGKFPPEWQDPLTEQQVCMYEKQKGIKLPEDYRRFITTVASAGTQPFYGLCGLFKKDQSGIMTDKKFPYTINSPFKLFEMSEEEYGKFWDNADDDKSYLQGYIMLCDEGCGMTNILVVNTDDKETYGTVWFYDLANDCGIMPIYHPQSGKPMHFLDWFEYWVDQMLESGDDKEYFSYGELTFQESQD